MGLHPGSFGKAWKWGGGGGGGMGGGHKRGNGGPHSAQIIGHQKGLKYRIVDRYPVGCGRS